MVPVFYLRDLFLPLSNNTGAMWIKGAQDNINTIETIDYNSPQTGAHAVILGGANCLLV